MKIFSYIPLIFLAFTILDASDTQSSNQYSYWNVQALYGNEFHEPFNPVDIHKTLLTIENSSLWEWGSSFGFIDLLKSDENDDSATAIYGEWYPSASLSKLTNTDFGSGTLRDVSLTAGINAGRKSTGANPLVYLPGITIDLTLPTFAFFNLGAYAYIDRGTINNGVSNGCHKTGFQATSAWLLPFSINDTKVRFEGFIDYISSHGACTEQILTQPRIAFDFGNFIGLSSNHLFGGIEYQYWYNKFGIHNLNESFPQALLMYRF